MVSFLLLNAKEGKYTVLLAVRSQTEIFRAACGAMRTPWDRTKSKVANLMQARPRTQAPDSFRQQRAQREAATMAEIKYNKLFIDGNFVDAVSGKTVRARAETPKAVIARCDACSPQHPEPTRACSSPR
jgi:hypothetical protein